MAKQVKNALVSILLAFAVTHNNDSLAAWTIDGKAQEIIESSMHGLKECVERVAPIRPRQLESCGEEFRQSVEKMHDRAIAKMPMRKFASSVRELLHQMDTGSIRNAKEFQLKLDTLIETVGMDLQTAEQASRTRTCRKVFGSLECD